MGVFTKRVPYAKRVPFKNGKLTTVPSAQNPVMKVKKFCKCPMCNKNNSQLMKVYFCGNRVGSINPYMQIQKLNTQLKTEQQLNTIIKQKLEIIHELRALRVWFKEIIILNIK